MIEPGMHLNAVGGDCPGKTELHVDILRAPGARIVVEFEPQARIEGEIQQLAPAESVIELADVLSGRELGRTNDRDVTIFDSVGFALNDFSALRYLERLNREQAGGASIDLIPTLDDPKDLYGTLKFGHAKPGGAEFGRAEFGDVKSGDPRARRDRAHGDAARDQLIS
jgi:ornithine cyclodeaminase